MMNMETRNIRKITKHAINEDISEAGKNDFTFWEWKHKSPIKSEAPLSFWPKTEKRF